MGWVVAFPRDRTSRGTSLDNPGRDVPLSLCPGTKAGAKIPGRLGTKSLTPKNKKTGKGRSKTGKDVLKWNRTF